MDTFARRQGLPDVAVVGGGVIGLATAVALAGCGARVRLLTDNRRGAASRAAAGMLAPSVEHAGGADEGEVAATVGRSAAAAALTFGIAARDRFPSYVAWLRERTGLTVPLNREGILDVAMQEQSAEQLRDHLAPGAVWLPAREVARLEPGLAPAAGAALHPNDGAVDNVRLVEALERLADAESTIEVVHAAATEIDVGSRPRLVTSRGERFSCDLVVLAAGAWSPHLRGLPRSIPVEPVRGQMVSFAASPLRHVVYGSGGYLVPREDGRMVAGSTMERVFFDADTTTEGIRQIVEMARALLPALGMTPVLERWAGLRPVTPDLLPIVGRDPEAASLIYATGHSRNGILMAPLTGDCVAALATGAPLPVDLAPFAVERFAPVP